MRHVVHCGACQANVLVVEAADPADLTRQITAAGWLAAGQGVRCGECRHKPLLGVSPKAPKPKKARKAR